MRFDSATLQKRVYTLVPASRNADATGATVDHQGFSGVTYHIGVGVGGITFDATNKIECVMEHSDDGSTWAPVTAADVIGTVTGSGIVRSLVAAHAAATSTKVGYIGGKRYSRVNADFSGTHGTATPIEVSAILDRPDFAPTV